MDEWAARKLEQEHEQRRLAALQHPCHCGDCPRNGWDFCPRSNAEEEASQQKARADALYQKRLACHEAEVAQKRYERAEYVAEHDRSDRVTTVIRDQRVVNELRLEWDRAHPDGGT